MGGHAYVDACLRACFETRRELSTGHLYESNRGTFILTLPSRGERCSLAFTAKSGSA